MLTSQVIPTSNWYANNFLCNFIPYHNFIKMSFFSVFSFKHHLKPKCRGIICQKHVDTLGFRVARPGMGISIFLPDIRYLAKCLKSDRNKTFILELPHFQVIYTILQCWFHLPYCLLDLFSFDELTGGCCYLRRWNTLRNRSNSNICSRQCMHNSQR